MLLCRQQRYSSMRNKTPLRNQSKLVRKANRIYVFQFLSGWGFMEIVVLLIIELISRSKLDHN